MWYLMALDPLAQNKGKAPTFVTKARQEFLDLTKCRIDVQKLIHGWTMSDETSLSDHRYILNRISTSQILQKECRKPRDTNWGKFRNELGGKLNYHWFR